MPRWTSEARLKQAERIRALCPWTKSTGPRTETGKARSARNAWKGGVRVIVARYSQVLRDMEATTRQLFSSFCRKRVSRPRRAFAPQPPRRGTPLRGAGQGWPPGQDIERLSTEKLLAMAGRILGGKGISRAGLLGSLP